MCLITPAINIHFGRSNTCKESPKSFCDDPLTTFSGGQNGGDPTACEV